MDKALENLALSLKHKELSPAEKAELRKAIGERLRNWLPEGGEYSVVLFKEYVKSGYKTLPFAGGFAQQPQWVINDFGLLHDVMDFHYLNSELKSPDEIKAGG